MSKIFAKFICILLSIVVLSPLTLSACRGDRQIYVRETGRTEETEDVVVVIDNCKGSRDIESEAALDMNIDVRGASELGIDAGVIKEKLVANLGVRTGFTMKQTVATPPGEHGKHIITFQVTASKGVITRDRSGGQATYTVRVPKSVTDVRSELAKCVTEIHPEPIHLEAEQYDKESAHVQVVECSEGGRLLGWINDGEWVRFDNVDFGSGGMRTFEARVASAESGGEIELRLDDPNGERMGVCQVNGTGGWQDWETVSCGLTGEITGIRTLYLLFSGGGTYLFNINWIEFRP